MIKIIDNYYVDVDEYQYILKEEKELLNKKTGETYIAYNTIGYYGTLQGTIRGLLAKRHINILEGKNMDLKQAFSEQNKETKRFIDLLNKSIPDIKLKEAKNE